MLFDTFDTVCQIAMKVGRTLIRHDAFCVLADYITKNETQVDMFEMVPVATAVEIQIGAERSIIIKKI